MVLRFKFNTIKEITITRFEESVCTECSCVLKLNQNIMCVCIAAIEFIDVSSLKKFTYAIDLLRAEGKKIDVFDIQ